jgi:hypothetical protein
MAQTPIKIPYGRALMSAPLLTRLASCALSVPVMSAVLQALAEIRHRAGPFDALRSRIILANQDKNEDGTLSFENGDLNRPMVTVKGILKLQELEAQELEMYCRTVSAASFSGATDDEGQTLRLTGREMAVIGWLVTGSDLPVGDEIPAPASPLMAADDAACAPEAPCGGSIPA